MIAPNSGIASFLAPDRSKLTVPGYYMPARDMHVRRKNAVGADAWVPITEALNLAWVIRGTRAAPGSLLTMTNRTVDRL